MGSKSLSNFIMVEGMQWSSALGLTTLDKPNGRKKGSAFCRQTFFPLTLFLMKTYLGGGWAGTRYFMDTETGIAVVFGTQIVPKFPPDAQLEVKLEELTYAAVQHRSGKL